LPKRSALTRAPVRLFHIVLHASARHVDTIVTDADNGPRN
jgi:hypothetical protein